SYLPAGFMSSLSSGVGVGQTVAALPSAPSGGARWLVPLAILGGLLLVWLFLRSMHPHEGAQNAARPPPRGARATASAPPPSRNPSWVALGEIVVVDLPNGTLINVPERGVESRLVQYLNDSSAPVSEDTWFDFDRLLFDTNSASLQPVSQDQLNDVAVIMKA